MVDARQRLNWLAPPYRPPDQTGTGKWGPVKQPRRGRQGSSSLAGKVNVPPPGDHPGCEAFQHVRGLTHIQNLLLLQPTAGHFPPSSGHNHCKGCPCSVPHGVPRSRPEASYCLCGGPLSPWPWRSAGPPTTLSAVSALQESVEASWHQSSGSGRTPGHQSVCSSRRFVLFCGGGGWHGGLCVPTVPRHPAGASLGLSHSKEALGKRSGPQLRHRKTLIGHGVGPGGSTRVWPGAATEGGPNEGSCWGQLWAPVTVPPPALHMGRPHGRCEGRLWAEASVGCGGGGAGRRPGGPQLFSKRERRSSLLLLGRSGGSRYERSSSGLVSSGRRSSEGSGMSDAPCAPA